jgi:hypothetical protein
MYEAKPVETNEANGVWTTVVHKKKKQRKAKTCKDLEPPFGTIHGDEPPDEADPDPAKTQVLLGILESWYAEAEDSEDDSSEEEDDDSSHGSMPPLMGRQYDSDSDEESCGDVPPVMERGNCDESSSSDDDSFIAPTRGWRPKYDDSDDADSIATDDNKEFELFFDLDMQLHVEDEAGRELAIPTVEFAALKFEGKSAKIGPNTTWLTLEHLATWDQVMLECLIWRTSMLPSG